MATELYSYGYIGTSPADLLALVERTGAVVFDVRFRPLSRDPRWCKGNLQRLLGERYFHVKAFGNPAYKEDRIELVDFEAGALLVEASPHPVILLCACRDPKTCHRTVVATLLCDRGCHLIDHHDV